MPPDALPQSWQPANAEGKIGGVWWSIRHNLQCTHGRSCIIHKCNYGHGIVLVLMHNFLLLSLVSVPGQSKCAWPQMCQVFNVPTYRLEES